MIAARTEASLWVWLGALSAAVCAAALGFGAGGWAAPWAAASVDGDILWRIRLPRVLLGFVAGAALSASGMAFQALFRNSLATPFTLGVSSGASLGAALYVIAGASGTLAGISGHSLSAMAGAGAAIALVYALTRCGGGFQTSALLLAGVAVSFLFTSVISALQYLGDVTTAFRTGRWMMGGLEVVGYGVLQHALPLVIGGLALVLLVPAELDLLLLGDDVAAARGVAVARLKKQLFVAVSMMVGGVVAACGPIGFVGLVVPHVGRRLVGAGHRRLAPFCILAGGAFLVSCDTVARTAAAPAEIPVGIVTSLLGGPFFLALLARGHGDRAGIEV